MLISSHQEGIGSVEEYMLLSSGLLSSSGMCRTLRLHPSSPKILSEVVVHFSATRVNREFGEVCLIQDLLSKIGTVGDN